MTSKHAPALVVAALVAVTSMSGCSPSSPGGGFGPVSRLAAPDAGLRTAGWGVTGGRLSILVRNDGPQLVRRARAVITARDTRGNAVATTSGSIQCCGISHLAPGATSGLYTELGAASQRVTGVTVRYVGVALVPLAATPAAVTVTVADVGMQTGGATTVVTARLTAAGVPAATESVRAQAVLTGAGGRIVAVLSERVACLAPGRARVSRLELPTSVPAGTIVTSVTTSPISGGSC